MKKLISILLIFVLIFAGYHFFTGDYLANNNYIGGGDGGGNYDDTTNNSSVGSSTQTPIAREKLKLISSADASQYEEIMAFDFFNKENCESYEDWQFISNDAISVYGSFYPFTSFYAKINGYHTVLLLNGSITSDEKEFFATDWDNYNFNSSPKSNCLYIFEYNLENTFSILHMGESYYHNDLLPGEVDISVTNASTFLESKVVTLDKTISMDVKFDTLQYFENIICPIFKLSYLHEPSSLEVDGITYNEFINFDFSSKNNNLSYEDFALACSFHAENQLHYIYSMKINGYQIYLSIYNIGNLNADGGYSAITDLASFIKYDWENYDLSSGAYNSILILDPDNTLAGKYYLNSSGEINLLEQTTLNDTTSDYPFNQITDFTDDSTIAYVLDLCALDTIIYSMEEASTLSLRNAQQEEQSTTCSQVGNYQVCESYEEDDYGYEWGPMHWPDEEE